MVMDMVSIKDVMEDNRKYIKDLIMNIQLASIDDLETISSCDKHITKEELINSINLNRVYIVKDKSRFCGWLRYNLFWDNIPFMNLLYLLEEDRGKGYGRQLVEYWENNMKQIGYSVVMTSTQSDETAQHFYMKLGYKAIGGFLLKTDSFEIIMSKEL